MQRRNFLKTTASATAAGTLSSSQALSAKDKKRKPNLLVIHCDELNFRTIACYRDRLSQEQGLMWGPKMVIDTPHIDRIAAEGALFDKFYAATPVCSPSRASFVSGQYPQHTGVTSNSMHLSDGLITWASILGEEGYSTGYSGKWHLDGNDKPGWAPKRKFGFDDNRYMINRGHWKQFEEVDGTPRVKARDNKDKPTYDVKGADEESFATDWLTTKMLDFIEEHKDEPFAYMCSIPDPHGPDTVRPPYDTLLNDADSQKPPTFDKPKEGVPNWAKPEGKCHYKMATYLGMMKCIDDNMGRVFAKLEELGILDDTILVFTADHGDMRGEHHRQNKGIPLEASAKVPFVIRYPKSIAAGQRVTHAVNTVDFHASMLSLMGVDPGKGHQGVDFSPLIVGDKGSKDQLSDITIMRSTGKLDSTFGWIAAISPTHKLILASNDEPLLLDLENEPNELINHLDQPKHQAEAKRLAQALQSYGERVGDHYLDNPNTAASLKSILAKG